MLTRPCNQPPCHLAPHVQASQRRRTRMRALVTAAHVLSLRSITRWVQRLAFWGHSIDSDAPGQYYYCFQQRHSNSCEARPLAMFNRSCTIAKTASVDDSISCMFVCLSWLIQQKVKGSISLCGMVPTHLVIFLTETCPLLHSAELYL